MLVLRNARVPLVALSLALAVLFPGEAWAKRPRAQHLPPPDSVPAWQPLKLEARLLDGQNVERVLVRLRLPGRDYQDLPMDHVSGERFQVTIAASRLSPPGLEYYLEGVTFERERLPLFRSSQSPVRLFVVEVDAATLVGKSRHGLPEQTPPTSAAPAPGAPGAPAASSPSPGPPPGATPVPAGDAAGSSEGEPEPGRDPGSDAAPEDPLAEELAVYAADDPTRVGTRHDADSRGAVFAPLVIGRARLQALGARNVHEVLDHLPGLTVSRDVQGFFRLGVRGIRSDPEVLFLLNGQRLNSFHDGRALAALPVENLERVELYRGPGAFPGAFVAAVNLVTVRSEDGLDAAVGGGTFETIDAHARVARSIGRLRLTADADVVRQSGYRVGVERDALAEDTLAQDLREELDPAGNTDDGRTLLSAGFRGILGTESEGVVGVSLRVLSERRGALVGAFDTVGPDSRMSWLALLGQVDYRRQLSEGVRLSGQLHFADQSTLRTYQLAPAGFRTGPSDEEHFSEGVFERTDAADQGVGGDGRVEVDLGTDNTLSLGLLVEHQRLRRRRYETNFTYDHLRLDGFQTPVDAAGNALPDVGAIAGGAADSRLSLAGFVEDRWQLIEPLVLVVGLQVDAVQLPDVDTQQKQLTFGLNPRVGGIYTVAEPLLLRASYARGFRAPTAQELVEKVPVSDFHLGRFEGNPALEPSTVDAFEVGADLLQRAGDARVRLRGTLFHHRFHDVIVALDTSGNIIPLQNRRGSSVFGAEGEATVDLSSRAFAFFNASWFRATDVDTPSEFDLLTDTPQARFNIGSSIPLGAYLNLDLAMRVGSERRNNSRTVLELVRRYRIPGYALVTAQLRTERIARHFELLLLAQNLLDHRNVDDAPRPDRMPGGVPREGASAFLQLRAVY